MRVFLSHSSANKKFVGQVFERLGQANAEYDESTFEKGVFNIEAIANSISRSDIFALFATPDALASGYVNMELKLALEALAKKQILAIFCFCLEGLSPSALPMQLPLISAVRNLTKPGSCARFLKQELIKNDIKNNTIVRPFIGRDREKRDLKFRLASPDKDTPVAVAFCGVDGTGRRTLSARVLPEIYPGAGAMPPAIIIDSNSDIRDLYRQLLETNASLDSEVIENIISFDQLSNEDQVEIVSDIVRGYYQANEIIQFVDNGGLLNDDGGLQPYMRSLVDNLKPGFRVRPFLSLILFRMPPASSRLDDNIIHYVRVQALDNDDIKQLISLDVRRRGGQATLSQISKLADLIDGHPYNLQFLLRLLDTNSIEAICDDSSDLIAFKQRQGDEFVKRIPFEDEHIKIVKLLRMLGQSSISLVAASTNIQSAKLSRAIADLEEFHCIERQGDILVVNRPLQVAFERSSTFRIEVQEFKSTLQNVIEIYKGYKDEDQMNIEILSAASKAALYLNEDDQLLRIFLLPSNAIFVGKQLYDLRSFVSCAAVCESALKQQTFVTLAAKTEAVRLRCLSLARTDEQQEFESTLAIIQDEPAPAAQATLYFLRGFNLRLKGEPTKAIAELRKSISFRRKSFSALRELSYCLMITGQEDEAVAYAEEALSLAPTNPYVIDLVLSLRVHKYGRLTRDSFYDPDLSDLLDRLQRYGDREGTSFYSIRMAELYTRIGDDEQALQFARTACNQTPKLFAAHMVEAKVLVRTPRYSKEVLEKFRILQKLLDDRQRGEGKSNLNEFLVMRIDFLWNNQEEKQAVKLMRANEQRLGRHARSIRKAFAFDVKKMAKLDKSDTAWIKAA